MKSILILLIIFLLGIVSLHSQTFRFENNPTFDSVQVFPENPTKNDSINLSIYVSSRSKYFTFENAITNFSNDSIFLIIPSSFDIKLYNQDSLNSLNITYKIPIGKLSANLYKVILINAFTVIGYEIATTLIYQDTATFNMNVTTINSINKIDKNNFNIYPIPTNESINIRSFTSEDKIDRISLYNLQGAKLLDLPNGNKIDLNSISNGVYFLRIQLDDGNLVTRKIIKK